MSITATEATARQSNNRLRYAMDRLLHRLLRFVGPYPIREGDTMPEHDLQWMAEIGSDPAGTILDAIRMHPELWAEALPQECCIVRRDMLAKYVGADAVEALASYGANAVDNQAARLRHEFEERERRERYGKRR